MSTRTIDPQAPHMFGFKSGDRVEVRANEGVVVDGRDASRLRFTGTVTGEVYEKSINSLAIQDDAGEIHHVHFHDLRRIGTAQKTHLQTPQIKQ